uniref:Uncharacterized protein n=1 Tax=Glossina palpalis gambiensis TaxID=67801 RepID=A0A1B0BQ57_9MUSC
MFNIRFNNQRLFRLFHKLSRLNHSDFEYDCPFFTLVNAKVELNNMSQIAHQNMRTTLGLRT